MADEKDPPLTPAQRSRIRRMSQPPEHDPTEAGGELNIVPFLDIIMNVLMFVLATIPAVFTVTIESNPPSIGGGKTRDVQKPTLNLTLVVTGDGVSVKAAGGSIAPGCEGTGGGVTIQKKGTDYNWDALNACVKKLKDSSADFADETNVQILAEPGTAYQIIINTMDAVRVTPDQNPLFPDVNFGVAK